MFTPNFFHEYVIHLQITIGNGSWILVTWKQWHQEHIYDIKHLQHFHQYECTNFKDFHVGCIAWYTLINGTKLAVHVVEDNGNDWVGHNEK